MKHFRKIYVAALLAVAVAIGIKYRSSVQDGHIVKAATVSDYVTTSDTMPSDDASNDASDETGSVNYAGSLWRKLIADSVNEGGIQLLIDNKETGLPESALYLGADLGVMIDVEQVKKQLSLSVLDYGESVQIQRAEAVLTLYVGSDEAELNGLKVELSEAVVRVNDTCYMPIDALADYLGYSYAWLYETNTASLTNDEPEEKSYPYAYDYRTVGRISAVKNQADLGTCWAFASLTALETSLLPKLNVSFSVDHMSWHNGYDLTQEEGGEYTMAMAYLLSWRGPVYEEDDPYGDGESPDDLEPVCHVQEVRILDSKDLDGIRKAVFLYGGVETSLYMSVRDADGNASEFYNAEESAYCYIGTEKPNHDVVIVGWDDNYPATNFNTVPEGNGAFICVNSWGEQFGDGGFFYVSYFDSNVGMHNLVYTGVEATDNYDRIYQSDLCGWVGQLGYNREKAYFANVYQVEERESIEAVGFYATGAGTTYDVYVVTDFQSEEDLEGRELVASGTLMNAGYYTIPLEKEIVAEAGTYCAVVVRIQTPGSSRPIAVEYQSSKETYQVDLSDGEGYISLNGNNWDRTETAQHCNVCLKMYTKTAEESEEIQQ